LKPGYYYLIASHNPTFEEEQNVISIAMICVSDLALVKRTRGSAIEGFVTEALSGEPLDQAEVAVWRIDDRGNTRPEQPLKTDRDGFFALKSSNGRFLFRIRHADRELGTFYETGLYAPTEQPNDPVFQTMFFTDRALYRPGQIIQYKGLCLRVDQKHDNYELLKGEELTVALMDGNGKLVSRQKRRANDYGSFSGSFIAPRDRLLGSMSLQVEGRAQGSAAIRVEEYKRPKFEVTLAAPETGAKLNEQVSLTGEAQAYTGAAVDGAEVKYRVMRTVERPWWWWSPGWRESGDQEIAHGTIQTDKDGSFKFSFVAKPDLSYAETNDPTFVFRINADVTDSSGETRSSSKDIRVAYRALEVKLSSNDWQTTNTPVEIVLKAESLDSVPQVAEGMVRLYELEQPARVARAPLVQGFRPVQRPGRRAKLA
jgi:uncharacterized protein YfaS (alpha-2-macroglobulin family)